MDTLSRIALATVAMFGSLWVGLLCLANVKGVAYLEIAVVVIWIAFVVWLSWVLFFRKRKDLSARR